MVLASVVISLAITFGIVHYSPPLGMPVLIFVPMFTFVTLLAVGLDYDIFMVTRVRESVIKDQGTRRPLRAASRRTGA